MDPVINNNPPVPEVDNKKRQQLTDVLSISISPARCAAHLKKNLANKEVDNEIHNLREKLKASIDEVENTKLKEEISTLSQKVVRISSETSTVMAVICDGFVEDLLKHSINETLASNKKMVDVNYIMSGDHKKNLYYSIYHKLPTFINYDAKVYEENRKKKFEDNKKAKKAKKEGINVSDAEVPAVVNVPVVDDSNDGKTTFNTYIDAVLKNVKKDLQLAENIKIRTSIEVRDFLSDMIIECIKRFITLSKIFVQQIMGVRTMNSNHIKAIVHMFMKDEGNTDEQINVVINRINEKIDLFQKHVVSERANRWADLDDVTKQDLLNKQVEKNKNRKKKDLQLAEKRALDAADRVKKLTEEVAVEVAVPVVVSPTDTKVAPTEVITTI